MVNSRAYRRDLPEVRDARQFVTDEIESAGASVSDEVLLVVSELVTNAIRHGSGAMEVWVDVSGATVRIAVLDDGGQVVGVPSAPPPPDSPGGRGLFLVETVASACGSGLDDRGRTLVWAELPVTRMADADG